MGEIKNYRIKFVERTIDLLENNYEKLKDQDLEVTFLLNCLLGLIVSVFENKKQREKIFKDDINDDFLSVIPKKIGFIVKDKTNKDLTQIDLTNLKLNVGHQSELKECSMDWLINKIRNGIAHQHIEGVNFDGSWVGVRIWNLNKEKKDFEIIFTIDELRKFSLKIASHYIKHIVDE